jgi:predicted deacetylase|tara:strand:- start:376 stop:1065 length:690 start_codon:yes stop_codon:yes gene_type:complete
MKAFVSIHDVMPNTITEVAELLEICHSFGLQRVTLLVVPGLDWQPGQINQLRQWQKMGYELAAHGWVHRCVTKKTFWHLLHGLILSRDVAEHMSLKPNDVVDLMQKSGNWFVENGFDHPSLYVPPAWALGNISKRRLRNCGYTWVETLSGVVSPQTGQTRRLPLVGFEADTFTRELALRVYNNLVLWMPTNKPLRISIHPYDHKLKLRKSLRTFLQLCTQTLSYSEITG